MGIRGRLERGEARVKAKGRVGERERVQEPWLWLEVAL